MIARVFVIRCFRLVCVAVCVAVCVTMCVEVCVAAWVPHDSESVCHRKFSCVSVLIH